MVCYFNNTEGFLDNYGYWYSFFSNRCQKVDISQVKPIRRYLAVGLLKACIDDNSKVICEKKAEFTKHLNSIYFKNCSTERMLKYSHVHSAWACLKDEELDEYIEWNKADGIPRNEMFVRVEKLFGKAWCGAVLKDLPSIVCEATGDVKYLPISDVEMLSTPAVLKRIHHQMNPHMTFLKNLLHKDELRSAMLAILLSEDF